MVGGADVISFWVGGVGGVGGMRMGCTVYRSVHCTVQCTDLAICQLNCIVVACVWMCLKRRPWFFVSLPMAQSLRLTASMSHRLTVSPSHRLTVSLSRCLTVSLSRCLTVSSDSKKYHSWGGGDSLHGEARMCAECSMH